MKEALNINQNLQQVLRLSPQQVQFVRLLEMNAPEIEEEIRHVLDENPALDVSEPAPDFPVDNEDGTFTETAEQLQRADYNDDDMPAYRLEANNRSADDPEYHTVAVADGPDLYGNLLEQLSEIDIDSDAHRAATYIIGNLDSNGYLTRPLAAIADDIAMDTATYPDKAAVKRGFEAVRTLDPAGVGAVDLRDCLLLQLRRITPMTLPVRIATEIVDDYFDLFSNRRFDKLRVELELPDDSALEPAFDVIKSLNPKPGRLIDSDSSHDKLRQITPDFFVEADSDGQFSITTGTHQPTLRIEDSFIITDSDNTPQSRAHREAQMFIRQKHDEAATFIANIEKRNATLAAVMAAIVKLQSSFFTSGQTSDMRPMILKDIGALTGLDLSVISRAIAGKYVATPTGTYPLRMFLNERPTDDADTSSHELLDAIRDIIDNEDKNHPLSDRAIQESMAARGYDIARRTVTKYRERLGLPVGRLRKQLS